MDGRNHYLSGSGEQGETSQMTLGSPRLPNALIDYLARFLLVVYAVNLDDCSGSDSHNDCLLLNWSTLTVDWSTVCDN